MTRVAAVRGKRFEAGRVPFEQMRAEQFDVMADLLEAHIGRSALVAIIEGRSDVPPLITHALTGGL